PEGKNVAFYQQRLRDLNDAFSKYNMAAMKSGALNKDDAVTKQMRPAQARCRAYMSQAPDFNRRESEETERIYYDGLAYLGKVDELTKEINAALNRKTPDREKAFNLQRRLSTARAVRALKEDKLDSLIDSIFDNSTQDNSAEALTQLEGVFLALGDLGKEDLLDSVEYRLSKAALQSNNQILRQRVGSYALKHTSQSVGKALKLEGVCTDGTEFSWDDYRGKTVLVCVIPPADYTGADQWNSFNQLTADLLSAYRAYREYGFEVVGYAVDTIEGMVVKPDVAPTKKAKSKGVEPKDLPWKIVSQKASREAKDKDYLDFTTFYGSRSFPTTFLVDKDGVVVSTETNARELRLSLARRYPEGAKTEIENILNVPDGRDREFYNKLIINDLSLATEIFKTFNPTMEESAEFVKRVEKARVEASRQRDRLPQN
ncbi:MAG: redoxin domain-containing protein, partial [Thermoguttaceae bacterium]|nr:redoxin domain-containing protein [Thermoguttaceae bacterium]